MGVPHSDHGVLGGIEGRVTSGPRVGDYVLQGGGERVFFRFVGGGAQILLVTISSVFLSVYVEA